MYNLPSATIGGQNLLKLNVLPAIVLSHSSFSRGVPSAFGVGSRAVASYARAMPGATFWFALSSIGAKVQTIPLAVPLALRVIIPPVIPPVDWSRAVAREAISALLPTKVTLPELGSACQERSDSFSPQSKRNEPVDPVQ
jgi:hypothetical protein